MAKTRKTLVGAMIGLVAAACVGTFLPRITPRQAEWAQSRWPEMDEVRFDMARRLYISRCSGCHNLVLPRKKTVEQWDVILSTMAPRAKLTAGQTELIRRYLVTAKSAPPEP